MVWRYACPVQPPCVLKWVPPSRASSGCRPHQEDAYGADDGELGRQGRKQRRGGGVAEADRARVEDILAAAGDEGEAEGYGGAAYAEDMELGTEQI